MNTKIMDFPTVEGQVSELWGDISRLQTIYTEGVAHADSSEGVVRILLYSTSGLTGASGEVATAAVRLAVSPQSLARIADQFRELVSLFPAHESPRSKEGSETTEAAVVELPPLGPRIA